MPRKPKKLLPWVLEVLETKKFKDLGFVWEDKRKRTFWLPWPRQKDRHWKEHNSAFIKSYVEMQGRKDDLVKFDYVKCKARLRTAMNKDPCIHELRTRHEKKRRLYQITGNWSAFSRSGSGSGSSSESSSSEAASPVSSPSSSSSSSSSSSNNDVASPAVSIRPEEEEEENLETEGVTPQEDNLEQWNSNVDSSNTISRPLPYQDISSAAETLDAVEYISTSSDANMMSSLSMLNKGLASAEIDVGECTEKFISQTYTDLQPARLLELT